MTNQSSQYRAFVRERQDQVARYFGRKRLAAHPKWPYCLLERNDWRGNLVQPRVADYVQQEIDHRKANREGFALHTWVHHGLSSQALLFSLLGPAVAGGDYALFDRILHLSKVPVRGRVIQAEFELEDRRVYGEYHGQPTSADLALFTERGEAVYFECKFTESEFGRCASYPKHCNGANPLPNFDSKCYLSAVKKRRYWQVFQGHGLPEVTRADLPGCPVRLRYQLYRLIGFAMETGAHLILLYDERNPMFVGSGGYYSEMFETLPNPCAREVPRIDGSGGASSGCGIRRSALAHGV